jgi:primary-amine oxidase
VQSSELIDGPTAGRLAAGRARPAIFGRAALILTALLVVSWLVQPTQPLFAGAEAYCSGPSMVRQAFANGSVWSFCWEVRAHEGLRISHAFFQPKGGPERRVLWSANLAEVFTVYDPGQPRDTDASYGMGAGTIPLSTDDCPPAGAPEERTLLQAVPPGDIAMAPIVCRELVDRGVATKLNTFVQRGQEIAVWASHQVGNYNYIVRWVFSDDGSFSPQVGATGTLLTLAPHVHNVYFRLDFDLGGTADNVVETYARTATAPSAVSSWTPIGTEGQFSLDPATFRTWRVRNTAVTNGNERSISYELVPDGGGQFRGVPGADGEPFAQADFWVTRYKPCEQFAIMNRHSTLDPACGDNLGDYISPPESLAGSDVVVWYAAHWHHEPRDEDLPNMPIHWMTLRVEPRDFLDRSPFGQ